MSPEAKPDTSRRSRVHLVGGGVDGVLPDPVLAPFVEDVVAHVPHHRARPRLLLVLANDTGRAGEFRSAYVEALDSLVEGGFEYADVWIDPTSGLEPSALRDVDGFVVAGGPTPTYQQGLLPAAGDVAAAVARGVPYLGFSAGAMVAAARALIGGWRDGGRAVCHEDWSEGLVELTIDPGLALVDFTVDVHATQGGLLSRALAASRRPEVERVVAIDEGTCLSVPVGSHPGEWQVAGNGFVWIIGAAEDGSSVVRRLAG
jgi:cyanophycinase